MAETLKLVRAKMACRVARDAIKLLVSNPDHPELMQKLNDALLLLSRVVGEE